MQTRMVRINADEECQDVAKETWKDRAVLQKSPIDADEECQDAFQPPVFIVIIPIKSNNSKKHLSAGVQKIVCRSCLQECKMRPRRL